MRKRNVRDGYRLLKFIVIGRTCATEVAALIPKVVICIQFRSGGTYLTSIRCSAVEVAGAHNMVGYQSNSLYHVVANYIWGLTPPHYSLVHPISEPESENVEKRY